MKKITLFSGADASTVLTSPPIEVGDYTKMSIHCDFSGDTSADGSLKLQYSNDATSWVDGTTQAITSGADYMFEKVDITYLWVRLVWTPTTVGSLAYTCVGSKTGLAYARVNDGAAIPYTSDYNTGVGSAWARNADVTGKSYTSVGTRGSPYTVKVTSNAHGLATGCSIVVGTATNSHVLGTQSITRTGANTFTFTVISDPDVSGTLGYAVGEAGCSYSSTGSGPYTVTVSSAYHLLASGGTVVITGATDSDANGSHVFTVTNADEFTYETTNDPGTGTLDWTVSALAQVYEANGVSPWTVSVASATHGLASSDVIVMKNGSNSNVNGNQTITKDTQSVFHFTVTSDPGVSGTLDYESPFATITAANNWSALETMTVSSSTDTDLNGTMTVISANSTTFVIKATAPLDASGTLTYLEPGPYTVVCTKSAHGLVNTNVIAVSGGSDADVDGTKTVTRLSATQFSFSVSNPPSVSGTLNYSGPTPFKYDVTSSTHGLATSDSIQFDTDSNMVITDGYYTITRMDANTIRISHASDAGASGTINYAGLTAEVTKSTHGIVNGETVVLGTDSRSKIPAGNYVVHDVATNTFQIDNPHVSVWKAGGTISETGSGTFGATVVLKG